MTRKSDAVFGLTAFVSRVELAGGSVCRVACNVVDTLFEWHERARQRRQLLELDDEILKDIGESPAPMRCVKLVSPSGKPERINVSSARSRSRETKLTNTTLRWDGAQ